MANPRIVEADSLFLVGAIVRANAPDRPLLRISLRAQDPGLTFKYESDDGTQELSIKVEFKDSKEKETKEDVKRVLRDVSGEEDMDLQASSPFPPATFSDTGSGDSDPPQAEDTGSDFSGGGGGESGGAGSSGEV